MKHKFLILLAFAFVLALAPLGTAIAAPATTFPVSGTGSTAAGVATNFTGTFDIQKFEAKNNQLVAIGTLSGTVTDAATGAELGTVNGLKTTIPVISGGSQALGESLAISQDTCEVLNLVLGPLDLDLLGLVVHLDQIVLTIDAEPGPNNLLGNLLCAITGLFDNSGPLNVIADLLNSLLDLLNWLG